MREERGELGRGETGPRGRENGPRRGRLGRSGEKEEEEEDGLAACLGQEEEKWAAAEMGKRELFGFGVLFFFQNLFKLLNF
jgi:hypothetical protein